MPKVNTSFYKCPVCGHIKFRKNTVVVFIQGADSAPGVVYETKVEYSCENCSTVIKVEKENG